MDDKLVLSAKNTHKARKETTQAKISSAVDKLLIQKKKVTQKAIMEISGLGIATVKRYANKEYLAQYK